MSNPLSSANTSSFSQGSISRQLAQIGTPLLIGSIFQQLYSLVDSAIIGQWLGQTAFAASGLAAVLVNVCIFLLTGCCAGVAILLANIYGSGDLSRYRREVFLSSRLGFGFAISLTSLSWLALPKVLQIMQTPLQVMSLTTAYLHIILGGLGITFLYNFLASVLRSVGDTRSALYFLIAANIINTILDLLFIAGFHSGVSGAAWATIISQGLAALLCWQLLRKRYASLLPQAEDCTWDFTLLRLTTYYASLSAFQTSLLCIGNVFVQRGVNVLGVEGIAAFAAASRIEGFAKAFAAAGAVTLAIFIAHNEGAGQSERSRQSFHLASKIMLVLGGCLGIIMYSADRWLLSFFLGQHADTPLQMGSLYLRIIAFFYWMPFLANAFQGWFRGQGQLSVPFIGTALQLSIRAYLVLCYVPSYGLTAAAWCTVIGWIAMLALLFSAFKITSVARKFSPSH
ncbi:MAG: MATE family efflux transporter [bacterium]|nr:MATE family efflux transporter [bacterium]